MSGSVIGGKKASQTNKELYGKDFYKVIGHLGGKSHDGKKQAKTIKKLYGKDWYAEIGRKGGQNRAKKNKLFGIFTIK